MKVDIAFAAYRVSVSLSGWFNNWGAFKVLRVTDLSLKPTLAFAIHIYLILCLVVKFSGKDVKLKVTEINDKVCNYGCLTAKFSSDVATRLARVSNISNLDILQCFIDWNFSILAK